ncbi:MAG: acyl-CoA dehydrogenase family protein [Proteobacteria bacterium]|nr:acyl-CoA dehydrogenase family protein [Pseudomonadota bacterium]
MDFSYSDRVKDLQQQLTAFMDEHVYPNEDLFYEQIDTQPNRFYTPAILDELKEKAKTAGLWNLYLSHPFTAPNGKEYGIGLSNLEYAPLAEIMGRVDWAAEVFNCQAPDTGNMEVFVKYATPEQQAEWLVPLLEGDIRSSFCMTEPAVASSDATNIGTRIERDGDDYVINGTKWYTTGGMREQTKIFIVMGKTDPTAQRHQQQSQILVPKGTPGVKILRALPVYNDDHAPFGEAEVLFDNVRVPATNILLGEGRGFEIAQGRLGPGRIHHCMRLIGAADRAIEQMCRRVTSREAFGKKLAEFDTIRKDIAWARIQVETMRLLVLKTAAMMDDVGAKGARKEIAMIKVLVPQTVAHVVDRAIQAHGAGGFTNDFFLSRAWAYARTTQMADGPDEVHTETVAKLELRPYTNQ